MVMKLLAIVVACWAWAFVVGKLAYGRVPIEYALAVYVMGVAVIVAIAMSERQEAKDATPDLLDGGARGHAPAHGLRWDNPRVLQSVQSDLQRRAATRRAEAAEAAIHRLATSAREPLGPRRDVPPAA